MKVAVSRRQPRFSSPRFGCPEFGTPSAFTQESRRPSARIHQWASAYSIVDDDDLYWELVRQAFARSEDLSEIELDRCESGVEFIDRLVAGGLKPSVVLLDQRMPELDGTSVLRQLRDESLAPTMSVCLMTSSEEPQLIEEALAGGARFCFSKPSSFKDLRAKLAAIVQFFRDMVMLPQEAL